MKKLTILAIAALSTLSALAVPAKPGQWRNIKLSNGTTVKAELCGDEFAHCWRDSDGILYRMSDYKSGTFETVTIQEMNDIRISNKERMMPISDELYTPRTVKTGLGPTGEFQGTKKCLVLLVDFPDCPFEEGHDLELYKRIINEPGYTSEDGNYVASVRDFYRDQSYNTFDIDFTVSGIYTMPNSYSYYGGDRSSDQKDARVQEMVKEAFRQANADVDYKEFDWDGDNVVELVFIIYAGRGQADGGADDTIWPHKSSVGNVRYDGVALSTYACACELQRGGINAADPVHDNVSLLDGIGTICHEFSHCMGLPDAYDSQYSGFEGMGYWSIMASGCYLGNGFRPCGYTAYERMFCGWIEPIVLSDTIHVENMPAITEAPVAYAIVNDAFDDEYYLLENRQPQDWDSSLYGNGLLITHIDYDDYIWWYNMVNSRFDWYGFKNDHQRYTFVPADGSQASSSAYNIANDTYPTATNNEFSNTSYPASELFNDNMNGDKMLQMGVCNITKSRSGKISFTYEDRSNETMPEAPEGALFYESFFQSHGQCGGETGIFEGNTGAFVADNEGWECTLKYGGSRCAMFDTQGLNAYVISPEINLGTETNSFILSFLAAPYGSDKTSLKLSIGSGDGVLEKTSLTMKKDEWTEYKIKLTGTGTQKIRFRASKRFFLDEVLIMPDPDADQNAIISVADNACDNATTQYNLFGQRTNGENGFVVRNSKIIMMK